MKTTNAPWNKIAERMGSHATLDDATRMIKLLVDRGIDDTDDLTDEEWFRAVAEVTAPRHATPAWPFAVSYCQHGSGDTLRTFKTAPEAIEFAKSEWSAYRSHPEHTSGGDYRGEWAAERMIFDAEGEAIEAETLWRGQADERL